uniref:Galactosyltransferase C-terminal domain-containing protein n=1 Tax=Plectus sambesii TaxID=2011161 RepID=A0A914VDK7_9BILA
MNWTMPYDGYFGGVVAATAAQFQKVNGYANRFWDRSGEDDEFKLRAEASGQRFSRVPITEGRYLTFEHEKNKGNETTIEQTINLAETSKMWKEDVALLFAKLSNCVNFKCLLTKRMS